MCILRSSRSILSHALVVVLTFLVFAPNCSHGIFIDIDYQVISSNAPTPAPMNEAAPEPTAVSFYVVGDVPYSDMERCLLPFELAKLDPSRGDFLVHLGDIRDGKPDPITGEIRECPESMFEDLATIFYSSKVQPTFFLPGDNGWFDCRDATEAYEYWEDYLFHYNERTPFSAHVHRWVESADTFGLPPRTTRRSELFSFLHKTVLFIGLSLPGDGNNDDHEWHPRDELLQDSIEWTRDNLEYHLGRYDAVVLMGHSSTIRQNQGYTDALPGLLMNPIYGEPPVVLIEDSHHFETEEGYLGIPNLFHIMQEDTVTPMRLTVHPYLANSSSGSNLRQVFQYEQGCMCSNGHRPTEVYQYDSPLDPCFGACQEGIAACWDQNTCSPEGRICD